MTKRELERQVQLIGKDIYSFCICAMVGGTSAQMVYAGELQNKPYSGTPRTGATAWLIK